MACECCGTGKTLINRFLAHAHTSPGSVRSFWRISLEDRTPACTPLPAFVMFQFGDLWESCLVTVKATSVYVGFRDGRAWVPRPRSLSLPLSSGFPTDKPKLSFSPPTGIWRCGGGTAKKCSVNLISRTFCTPMWWALPCEGLKLFQICTEGAMFKCTEGKCAGDSN